LNPEAIGIDDMEADSSRHVWLINRRDSGTSDLLCNRHPIEPLNPHAKVVHLSRLAGATKDQVRTASKV
jgi:hypothetical protein